ncbi:tetratricopeptide repeat protein [Mucilaginibacter robiniae]|uniref:Tetratricopeptide repeat protein n=1 Tax=Mucilaginibacter robiniae TaxID=2728022 RepID=A0A7L5E065_9SPHI|nr:tetratricopeptide repeat protein [Mucilaginibacter robiniae]QJD96770.1 tetratricopeptide repeat protein [Mucilaginibacter robiniae]
MKRIFTCVILLLFTVSVYASIIENSIKQDTNEVENLYNHAFDVRLTDAMQTVKYADRALELAKQLDFKRGVAESYRVRGIGQFYLGHSEDAIDDYLNALTKFQDIKSYIGQVEVNINISSLYQDIDYDKCIEYLNNALELYQSKKLKQSDVLASIYMNFGNVYIREKSFTNALRSYDKIYELASHANNEEMKTMVLENKGSIYYELGDKERAISYYKRASVQAKDLDLNQLVAEIDLNLADVYLSEDNYGDAEKVLNEGYGYSTLVKSDKLTRYYLATRYKLETKRKNFERALYYLQNIYKQDSTKFNSNSSAALSIYQVKFNQGQLELEKERLTQRQKYNIILAVLLGLIIVLLVGNVKRKAETNKRLTGLNNEISVQKDNLDRINHHLEEIIDERTKDLQIKNKKLSEYSSYLSHQIRGPIATLKGLLNLEREGLVGQEECINMMVKCVNEIDDKIVDMSDMLHNPERAGM